jgi:hypothetical protein
MTLRPATPAERRALLRLARPDPMWRILGAAWIAAMIFLIGIGLAYLVTGARTGVQSAMVLGLGVAGLLFQLYLRRMIKQASAYDRESPRADLDGNQVDETTFDVVGAVEVAELEDEGKHFYLTLSDGRTVFLSGQYLYELVQSKRFPAERITVVRAPASGTVLDVRASGEHIAPREQRAAFTLDDIERGRVPQDGAVT